MFLMSIDGTITFTHLQCYGICTSIDRDISKGNVLYVPEETTLAEAGSDGVKIGFGETKEVPLYFIKYLLGERCVELNWDWRSLA